MHNCIKPTPFLEEVRSPARVFSNLVIKVTLRCVGEVMCRNGQFIRAIALLHSGTYIHSSYFQSVSCLLLPVTFTSCLPSIPQEMPNFARQFLGYIPTICSLLFMLTANLSELFRSLHGVANMLLQLP